MSKGLKEQRPDLGVAEEVGVDSHGLANEKLADLLAAGNPDAAVVKSSKLDMAQVDAFRLLCGFVGRQLEDALDLRQSGMMGAGRCTHNESARATMAHGAIEVGTVLK